MTSPTSPTHSDAGQGRPRRASSIPHSIASLPQSAVEFTEDLVLNRDPPPGFFAATAAATSRAPTVREIRSGSFGRDGWNTGGSGSGSSRKARAGSRSKERSDVATDGFIEPFAPLTEEPTRISTEVREEAEKAHLDLDDQAYASAADVGSRGPTPVNATEDTPLSPTNHDRLAPVKKGQRVYTSGYVPPPKLPWTTSTLIGLKAFWKWFLTPFGFLVTIYGLNVVAWGGMLFLLLCGAAPAMCHAPIPTPENRKHMSDIAALKLPGPYYINCNDINSPRRIWIEIDSQILNALFCVTGFGLVPWRFRDLYYLLRWRLTSQRKVGRDANLYGLRVLAGIHRGWFRLPGSDTLDTHSTQEYLAGVAKSCSTASAIDVDLESSTTSLPEKDPRVPLPLSKAPPPPPTGIHAPPTKLWKLDLFIWCQVWNTFFQCCLCGFMWGMDRYERPPWSTGMFIALAVIVAAIGGIVSYQEGKNVKRVEGILSKEDLTNESRHDDYQLQAARSNDTGHESLRLGQKGLT